MIGGPLLEGSSEVPIKCLVNKGEKKSVGTIRAKENVLTSWQWKPIVRHPDEDFPANGVTLKRRHLGGKLFEIEVHNPRERVIGVQVLFSGKGSLTISPNPVRAQVRPGDTDILITTELAGELGMEWSWTEGN